MARMKQQLIFKDLVTFQLLFPRIYRLIPRSTSKSQYLFSESFVQLLEDYELGIHVVEHQILVIHNPAICFVTVPSWVFLRYRNSSFNYSSWFSWFSSEIGAVIERDSWRVPKDYWPGHQMLDLFYLYQAIRMKISCSAAVNLSFSFRWAADREDQEWRSMSLEAAS